MHGIKKQDAMAMAQSWHGVLYRYVDKNWWQQQKAESIIDAYAHPGSRVYAPPQREGRFPDTRPKGRLIETEHFVPTALAGLEALESYLPKKLLDVKVKACSSVGLAP